MTRHGGNQQRYGTTNSIMTKLELIAAAFSAADLRRWSCPAAKSFISKHLLSAHNGRFFIEKDDTFGAEKCDTLKTNKNEGGKPMLNYLLNSLIDSLIIGFAAAILMVGSTVAIAAIYAKTHGCTIYQTSRIFRANFIMAHRKIRATNRYKSAPVICQKFINMFFHHYFRRYLLRRREYLRRVVV